MSTLEAALRGGAVIVLLLRVVAHLQNARSDQVSRWSVLFLLGVAAYVVESSPGFYTLDLRWRLPIHVVSCGTPAAFWITIAAFFVDEFRARWYHALAWLALATIAVVEMWVRSTSLFAVHSALSLSCVLLAIWHALAGRATDLVEGRRRLRVVYAIAIALYTVLIVASDWLWPGGLSAASLSLANAVGLMTLDLPVRGAGFAAIDRTAIDACGGPSRADAIPHQRPAGTGRLQPGPTRRCSPRCAS